MIESLIHTLAFDLPTLVPVILAASVFVVLVPRLDRRWTVVRLLVTCITGVFFARYYAWRIEGLWTVDAGIEYAIYGWGVFVIELLAGVEIALFLIIMSRHADRTPEADRFERALVERPLDDLPSVDVLIPTYDEGPEVIERTIVAASGMHYPAFRVWICDDGRDRHWLRDLCRRYDVGYLTREDRLHAKAGNINNALAHTSGELVAVFDADFAPARNFLLRTVGFFDDPSIGLVQTPQHFFNRDPIQTNLAMLRAIPDEQRLFFDHMAPCRDAWDAAFCCGAGSIMRRAALDEIGAVPTGSITEDLLTSLAMLRKGYRTRYLNERLAIGLAPENLEGYIVQRQRWCRGAIQGLFLPEGPLGPGLSLRNRVLYFPTGWLVQYPIRILMLLIPMLYFFTGVTPYPGLDMATLLEVIVPVIIASTGTMMWLLPGCYVPLVSTAVSLHTALHIVPTVFSTLLQPFGTQFHVTPKGKAAKVRTVDRRGLWAAILFGSLTLSGMAVNGAVIRFGHDEASFNAIANLWGFFNLVVCFVLGLISIDRTRSRDDERFDLNEPTTVTIDQVKIEGRLVDLSTSGARLTLEAAPTVGKEITVSVLGIGKLASRVVRSTGGNLGIVFHTPAPEKRARLIDRLYTGDFDNGIRHARWRELAHGMLKNFF